ncbi:MAG TPA: LysR family transcriptional regulator [Dyella sp.]|uniref:LysR family transcriptional regulator n=1 Tax=Dyella sp. TaxID=1869338 RepID=UPI002F93FCAC
MAVFVHTAEKRSFTATAEQFGMSPTMVGKHIRFLEERVGARLLQRTTRRQSLTEAGQLYYERCRQLLADAEAADACIHALRATPRGVLRIHAPVSFGSQRLAPALADFLKRYADVEVDLALGDRVIDLIEEGYEAAIRIGPLADSGLIAVPLQPYRMWLCASPDYLARAGIPREPGELARHECLGFAYWHTKHSWRLRHDGHNEDVPVHGRFVANNGQALRGAALAGLGIIMQPEVLLADDVAAGRLTRVLPACEPPSRPMHLIYPADRRPTAKLRCFIDFVVETFGPVQNP